MNTVWGIWQARERCRHCSHLVHEMVYYSYTCPNCGTHDGDPEPMAISYEYQMIFGFFPKKTGEFKLKSAEERR